jgi:hypothetical protein
MSIFLSICLSVYICLNLSVNVSLSLVRLKDKQMGSSERKKGKMRGHSENDSLSSCREEAAATAVGRKQQQDINIQTVIG